MCQLPQEPQIGPLSFATDYSLSLVDSDAYGVISFPQSYVYDTHTDTSTDTAETGHPL